ncbi:MAG: YdeI/OmpD-associated family protein [Bosea sp. (in: a-proteobacteria)]
MKRAGADYPHVQVASRAEWRGWLEANHATFGSIWLVTFKKASGRGTLSNNDIVEEALCFGWIDSLPRKLDEQRTMLLLSPRKPGSAWSALNKVRAERMIAAGLMQPAGFGMIDAAKADGSWIKLDQVEALEVPTDLVAAFAQYADAAGYFAAFPRSVKRGILEWILQAKRPETRAARIAETARLAAENSRANQWRS